MLTKYNKKEEACQSARQRNLSSQDVVFAMAQEADAVASEFATLMLLMHGPKDTFLGN